MSLFELFLYAFSKFIDWYIKERLEYPHINIINMRFTKEDRINILTAYYERKK